MFFIELFILIVFLACFLIWLLTFVYAAGLIFVFVVLFGIFGGADVGSNLAYHYPFLCGLMSMLFLVAYYTFPIFFITAAILFLKRKKAKIRLYCLILTLLTLLIMAGSFALAEKINHANTRNDLLLILRGFTAPKSLHFSLVQHQKK